MFRRTTFSGLALTIFLTFFFHCWSIKIARCLLQLQNSCSCQKRKGMGKPHQMHSFSWIIKSKFLPRIPHRFCYKTMKRLCTSGYSFCTGGFSVRKKEYMGTGWATNVFVFICVNGFGYLESSN